MQSRSQRPKIKVARYDSADYLKSEADIKNSLAAVLARPTDWAQPTDAAFDILEAGARYRSKHVDHVTGLFLNNGRWLIELVCRFVLHVAQYVHERSWHTRSETEPDCPH
jgi:hypothetical protein